MPSARFKELYTFWYRLGPNVSHNIKCTLQCDKNAMCNTLEDCCQLATANYAFCLALKHFYYIICEVFVLNE
jgi:hypothetical protein